MRGNLEYSCHRNEIFTSILHAAGLDGARLTKLMYSPFLSYNNVVEYITNLVENDFLHYNSNREYIYFDSKRTQISLYA